MNNSTIYKNMNLKVEYVVSETLAQGRIYAYYGHAQLQWGELL